VVAIVHGSVGDLLLKVEVSAEVTTIIVKSTKTLIAAVCILQITYMYNTNFSTLSRYCCNL
jgi:hypothetical protein